MRAGSPLRGPSPPLSSARGSVTDGRLALRASAFAFDSVEFDYPYARKTRTWLRSRGIHQLFHLLEESDARAAEVLDGFATLREPLGRIRAHAQASDPPGTPHFENEFLPALDAIALYGFLARTNPRVYLEVGSGNSTRFAARAIADHGLRTRIVSIDPQPRAEIDELCDEVVRQPLEELEPERFGELSREDVVFLDGSHRSFQSSDVTVFFLELVPVLPKGVIYGIHDVFLPADYPVHWVDRWYNEQYLLATYQLGGAGGDEILLPCSHVVSQEALRAKLDPLWSLPGLTNAPMFGSSFWLRRGGGSGRDGGGSANGLRWDVPTSPVEP